MIGLIQQDLSQVCTSLGWIGDAGVCHSLQVKLNAAGAAFQRGQTRTASNQLGAFRAELEAQHGKHVNEAAYFLLRVIADLAMRMIH